ncbi:hypothetical protein AVEN_215364-1 [Araneus ventricosus]|uniref:Uncharacterized protein n=1 Tax=Araneus ventricosus TaxID=182803 RepID=A0A4Y2JSU7_ARAVE|nr:hypothetical protein AVEN_215364-1 [Araneus ventricosus]
MFCPFPSSASVRRGETSFTASNNISFGMADTCWRMASFCVGTDVRVSRSTFVCKIPHNQKSQSVRSDDPKDYSSEKGDQRITLSSPALRRSTGAAIRGAAPSCLKVTVCSVVALQFWNDVVL